MILFQPAWLMYSPYLMSHNKSLPHVHAEWTYATPTRRCHNSSIACRCFHLCSCNIAHTIYAIAAAAPSRQSSTRHTLCLDPFLAYSSQKSWVCRAQAGRTSASDRPSSSLDCSQHSPRALSRSPAKDRQAEHHCQQHCPVILPPLCRQCSAAHALTGSGIVLVLRASQTAGCKSRML